MLGSVGDSGKLISCSKKHQCRQKTIKDIKMQVQTDSLVFKCMVAETLCENTSLYSPSV